MVPGGFQDSQNGWFEKGTLLADTGWDRGYKICTLPAMDTFEAMFLVMYFDRDGLRNVLDAGF